MPRILYYVAASLDGYIADREDGLDWLKAVEREGEDYGYGEFYASVQACVMGRRTYDVTRHFDPWPYPGKPAIVMTSHPLASDREGLEFFGADVAAVVQRLAKRGYERVWLVGGGALASAFLEAGALDEILLSTIPVVLGDGLPLFARVPARRPLEPVSSRTYPSGLVQTRWRVRN